MFHKSSYDLTVEGAGEKFRLMCLVFQLAVFALGLLVVTGRSEAAELMLTGLHAAMATNTTVEVTVEPVRIKHSELSGLVFRGAWELRSEHPEFGGFSGLLVSDGQLLSITDKGMLLVSSFEQSGGILRLVDARMAPVVDDSGVRFDNLERDAEGLTRLGNRLWISFEGDLRLMPLCETGRMCDMVKIRESLQFECDLAMEAVATLFDGRMIGFCENADGGTIQMFLIDPSGEVTVNYLPWDLDFRLTGADVGPDGRLYLVASQFSRLSGHSVRIMRYRLGANGMPLPDSAETLAAFDGGSGIDSMEGIALNSGPNGELRLWLISDDNFKRGFRAWAAWLGMSRFSQRTLLVQFTVLP